MVILIIHELIYSPNFPLALPSHPASVWLMSVKSHNKTVKTSRECSHGAFNDTHGKETKEVIGGHRQQQSQIQSVERRRESE